MNTILTLEQVNERLSLFDKEMAKAEANNDKFLQAFLQSRIDEYEAKKKVLEEVNKVK